jgi:peptidoglycan/xylan/chitin deacetylase (PgdA/CDA1 family)
VPPPTAPPTTTTTAPPTAPIVIRAGPATLRRVAFSFDAGSDTGATVRILDVLAAEGITASFGLTGDWAAANPALVRRIAVDGHHLINHSQNHLSFTGRSTSTAPLTSEQRRQELAEAEATISAIAGRSTRPWFRPPFGDLDDGAAHDAAAAGFPLIAMWTVDSLGWTSLPADQVRDRCLTRAAPGVIYLFHVGSASTDVDALAAIIAGLRAGGYAIGPVSSFAL